MMRVNLKPIPLPQMGHTPAWHLLPKAEDQMHTNKIRTLHVGVKRDRSKPQSEETCIITVTSLTKTIYIEAVISVDISRN